MGFAGRRMVGRSSLRSGMSSVHDVSRGKKAPGRKGWRRGPREAPRRLASARVTSCALKLRNRVDPASSGHFFSIGRQAPRRRRQSRWPAVDRQRCRSLSVRRVLSSHAPACCSRWHGCCWFRGWAWGPKGEASAPGWPGAGRSTHRHGDRTERCAAVVGAPVSGVHRLPGDTGRAGPRRGAAQRGRPAAQTHLGGGRHRVGGLAVLPAGRPDRLGGDQGALLRLHAAGAPV